MTQTNPHFSFRTARRPLRCARVRPARRWRQAARCPRRAPSSSSARTGIPPCRPSVLPSARKPSTISGAFPDELYACATRPPAAAKAAEQSSPRSAMPACRSRGRRTRPRPRRLGAAAPDVPEADVPVIPLSIQSHGGPEQAYRLGRALAPLPPGLLVIASGNLTHNLRDYQLAARNGGQTPAYVREFADWMAESPGRSATYPPCSTTAARRRAPCRPTRAMNICCRCLSHSVPAVKSQVNAFMPASTITSSPWMPMHFCQNKEVDRDSPATPPPPRPCTG
jgi:hypothetical protein